MNTILWLKKINAAFWNILMDKKYYFFFQCAVCYSTGKFCNLSTKCLCSVACGTEHHLPSETSRFQHR